MLQGGVNAPADRGSDLTVQNRRSTHRHLPFFLGSSSVKGAAVGHIFCNAIYLYAKHMRSVCYYLAAGGIIHDQGEDKP
jgi:hypothetical protein